MKKLFVFGLASFTAVTSIASAAITPPIADYSDIYTMASYVLGILVVLFLIRKAISFVK